jgi:hypothetical protein
MRSIHLIILAIVLLFINEFVLAQATDRRATGGGNSSSAGAYNTATKENGLQQVAGLAGLGFSVYLGYQSCYPKPDPVLCPMSVMGALQSLSMQRSAGANTDPSRYALVDTNFCTQNPSFCTPDGLPLAQNPPSDNPDYRDLLDKLRPLAKTQGVDIDDPASVSAYQKKMEDADYAGGPNRALGSLTPEQQAMIDKAKKEAASKFHVASVELENSGGGGGWGKSSGANKEGFDLASLMKGLDGKTEREPSAAGLQKNIGGEPIGVAADNIFLQVSRRYQQKIQAQIFIK